MTDATSQLRPPFFIREAGAADMPHVGAWLPEALRGTPTAKLMVAVDAATFASVKNIAVGGVPRGMSLSAKGDRLYVTNSWDDTLSVIDTSTLTVIATWHVGSEPSGVVSDPTAKYLFVANNNGNTVSRVSIGAGGALTPLAPTTVAAANAFHIAFATK